MNAGRDQWILFCLDDFTSEETETFSTLLGELVAGDKFTRENLLQKVSYRERENLFKEVVQLEGLRQLA